MNTCQTSIKTDIFFSVAVAHILGLSNRHKITTLVPSGLTLVGDRQTKQRISQIRIVDRLLKLLNESYWSEYSSNLSKFRNYNEQPRQFLN